MVVYTRAVHVISLMYTHAVYGRSSLGFDIFDKQHSITIYMQNIPNP